MIKKYITDINNKLYFKEEKIEKKVKKNNNIILINTEDVITKFFGFGSAITESSSYNYSLLSEENKKKFITDFYGKNGLNYQFGRISIGSNDFSLNSFSYAKRRNLSDFSILRDKKYVIPLLKDILAKKKISLIASPWSPPIMYKKLPVFRFGIKLSKKYYDKYADYLVKFLDEYQKENIYVDYITMQNEPIARQRWESCVFNLSEQKDFIYNYLIKKISDTKVLLWDHNKDNLFNIVNDLYIKNNKIAGVAFHYYTGSNFDEIKKIRNKYQDLMLINTEMCCAYSPFDEKKWTSSAEYYLNDIIGDMNSGVNAYLDWNILLDSNGGPTHVNNYVKSIAIRVDNSFIKSPIYFYLFHISHFINKNSVIIRSNNNTNLKVVSIKDNQKIVVVILNKTNSDIEYNLKINDCNIIDKISKHSIVSYLICD